MILFGGLLEIPFLFLLRFLGPVALVILVPYLTYLFVRWYVVRRNRAGDDSARPEV
jgi:hypothetical protein